MRRNRNKLNNIIKESVRKTLNEMDYKTYLNAAKKRLQQFRDETDPERKKELWDKYWELNKMGNERFGDEFVGNMRYDTMGDKLKGKHSPKFDAYVSAGQSPYGVVRGWNKGGSQIFSPEKGKYFGPHGYVKPGSFFRDKEVADKYEKANDELWDYHNGNYEYVKGDGYRLKESKRIRRIVKETMNRMLRESLDEEWYGEEDYDGNVGEPGMIRSYDVGYMSTDNEEMAAQEQGYNSLEDYLNDWFFEIQPDCPWYWQKIGNGYGYHGNTIFKENGVVCKDIYGQIMFDEYPPQYNPI